MTQTQTPFRLLIAAMGGEGGGVLAGWLTEAAMAQGLWVQRTSVPGVAQRTGATTYYLEFLPRAGDTPPVMALNPAPGRVDLLLATELLEAVRMVQLGFVTPDRTMLIASTHRVFTVDEKSAMADGRLDAEALAETCRRFSTRAVLDDLAAAAATAGCHLNAVLLGTLAGTGALPIRTERLRAAVAGSGKAVEANLRGFDAGQALTAAPARPDPAIPDLGRRKRAPAPEPTLAPSPDTAFLPAEAAGLAAEGMRRLSDYQDEAYAQEYLARLRNLSEHPAATAEMLAAVARHLALRMSYEDTIRVAELKLRASRMDSIRAQARPRDGDILDVLEYLKPGPEEIFGLFPRWAGAPLMGLTRRLGLEHLSFPMKLRTTRASGFLRLKLLAGRKRRRRRTLRHAEEIAWIDHWLARIATALDRAPDAAAGIAETAKLVRGYGSTYKRGIVNWAKIDAGVIAPCLDGRRPAGQLADAVAQARHAALADPDGAALDRMIAAFHAATRKGSGSDARPRPAEAPTAMAGE